jgi:signal peptidase II
MRLVASKLFYRMCGLAAVAVLLDQVSKLLVFRVLISFLATDHEFGPWIFAALATIIALGLLIWLSQTAERLPAFGLALVVGGAIGNVIDRVREGAVMDFLLFHWRDLAWPAFNLADSFITVGVALLIFDGVFGGKKRA